MFSCSETGIAQSPGGKTLIEWSTGSISAQVGLYGGTAGWGGA